MRILLVQPPLDATTSRLSAIGLSEPLALEYLAAALLPEHEVRILDLRVGGSLEQALSEMDPELVGTSAVTVGLTGALDILASVKALSPAATTVIGGVHPTLLPEDCQRPEVDIIVRGEGELALREIARVLSSRGDLGQVAGIVYRDRRADRWRATPARDLPPLDSYPFPARQLSEAHRSAYSRVGMGQILSAISSRGCSRRCTFCSVWRFHEGKYRTRDPHRVVEELAQRAERAIDFVDDDSFGSLARMRELADLIVRDLPGRALKMYVRADAVVRTPELFTRWAEAGLRLAFIGLESFRDEELRHIDKRATADENRRALEILRQIGIGVVGYLIVRPDYSLDDFKRLGDTIDELAIEQPLFATLTPFPGTILYEQVKSQLVRRDWDAFDGFTAVLPTALPRPEFYHQLANLYRRAYASRQPAGPAEVPWFERLARAIEEIEVAA